MRLTHRLLLGAFFVVLVIVTAVVIALDRTLHRRIFEESVRGLAREARLVAVQWDGSSVDADSLADAAGRAIGHRVTLIAPGGRVIGDSEFDDAALERLENHATRPEVVAANAAGEGSALRVSSSAGDEELYVAVRATRGVSRVSLGTLSLEVIFARARRDIYIAGLGGLLVAMTVAYFFSRSVSRPVVELRDVARALAAGELGRRPALTAPGEVGDLAIALHRLAEQLTARLHALEEEESLLRAVFDSLNEGVLAMDGRSRVVRINEVGRRLLHVRDDVPFPAEHLPRDAVLRGALAAALDGTATDGREIVLFDRTLALTVRPLTGGGAALALLDLTANRRLETVRRDFVANVSHELRTPLTVVGGFAETLAEDDPPPEHRQRFIETIRVNALRMQRIVDDLLDLSRIESGGWVPKPVTVDFRAAASDACLAAESAAADKGLAFNVEIDPDAPRVHADLTALRQVLTNLVENAIRHTASGGITVFTQRDPGGTWVGVRDTGIGIAPEHLPRIFERFYRVDPGRSRAEGGTGLGLAIVKHLVEAHGGTVRAESELGSGTTISACFPLPPHARVPTSSADDAR